MVQTFFSFQFFHSRYLLFYLNFCAICKIIIYFICCNLANKIKIIIIISLPNSLDNTHFLFHKCVDINWIHKPNLILKNALKKLVINVQFKFRFINIHYFCMLNSYIFCYYTIKLIHINPSINIIANKNKIDNNQSHSAIASITFYYKAKLQCVHVQDISC